MRNHVPSALALCATVVAFAGCTTSRHLPANVSKERGSNASNPFADFVVLDWREAGSAWGFPKFLNASWDPTVEQVRAAMQSLPEFLEISRQSYGVGSSRRKQVQEVIRQLPQTLCQGVGVEFNGQNAILLNCLPSGGPRSEGWNKRYIRVFDGGPRFWYAVYRVDTQEFTNLRIDQGF
jgi:hypothetical protein